MPLTLTSITKTYEGQLLLKGISFSLAAGETLCLLGASGSGKSTILRIIAGLESPESGAVRWEGQDLSNVPVHRRNFGLMFQDYALFPHLTVFENVAFGLRMRNERVARLGDVKDTRVDTGERDTGWQVALKERANRLLGGTSAALSRQVAESLEMVHLSGFEQRRVTELSGGEQQRVALARALAPRPRLLMLDEPLGALDRALRESLLGELRGILRQTGIPAIYVTHDQEEAFTIADTVILLHDGQIAQTGTPAEVFAKPASSWVARFLRLGNVVEGTVTTAGVETSAGRIQFRSAGKVGEQVTLLLRPQAELVESDETLAGKVSDVVFRGEQFRVELENGLYFHVTAPVQAGQTVKLKVLRVEVV
jgi:ABC-type Fe3+/spermidine/putrescine transport system ATPase subunit